MAERRFQDMAVGETGQVVTFDALGEHRLGALAVADVAEHVEEPLMLAAAIAALGQGEQAEEPGAVRPHEHVLALQRDAVGWRQHEELRQRDTCGSSSLGDVGEVVEFDGRHAADHVVGPTREHQFGPGLKAMISADESAEETRCSLDRVNGTEEAAEFG